MVLTESYPELQANQNFLSLQADLKDCEEKIYQALKLTNMQDYLGCMVGELSGGQQQRVAIGRALIMSPNIILADEPIGNLDSKTGYSIMELFKEINVKNKITILQVTHSTEAASYGDRIIQMKDGSILSDTLRENKLSD